MAREKKVTFCNLSSGNRSAGRRIAQEKAKKITYNTETLTHNRRIQKIKEVSNGCWWVQAYLIGNLVYIEKNSGIGDE